MKSVIREEIINHPIQGPLTKTVWYSFDETRFASLEAAIAALRPNWTYDRVEYPEISTLDEAVKQGVAIAPDTTYEVEIYDPTNQRHNVIQPEKITDEAMQGLIDKMILSMDQTQIDNFKTKLGITAETINSEPK